MSRDTGKPLDDALPPSDVSSRHGRGEPKNALSRRELFSCVGAGVVQNAAVSAACATIVSSASSHPASAAPSQAPFWGRSVNTLTMLKAAAPEGVIWGNGSPYAWTAGNYTGRADDIHIIEADGAPLSVGAWVRQSPAQSTFLQSECGDNLGAVQGRPREIISVRDFGAKGDGITDDTVAIEKAVAASKSIYFPPGTYIISRTIYARGELDEFGVNYHGKKVFGAGIEATVIKAGKLFTSRNMIVLGNTEYPDNNKYCNNNQLSDMSVDPRNMADSPEVGAIKIIGGYNNSLTNIRIGLVAFSYKRWDMVIDRGVYTTTVNNVHTYNRKISTQTIGDITTISFLGCSAVFTSIEGCNALSFDHDTVQGSRSVNFPEFRYQFDNCNNLSFINGDLEGDGVMFHGTNTSGVLIVNNNVAMPGSFQPFKGPAARSVFLQLKNCSQVESRGNIFMNWTKGPLIPDSGQYFEDGGQNRKIKAFDFYGDQFTGLLFKKLGSQTLSLDGPTRVNYDLKVYEEPEASVNESGQQSIAIRSKDSFTAYMAPLQGVYDVNAAVQIAPFAEGDVVFAAIYIDGEEELRRYASGSGHLSVSGKLKAKNRQSIDIRVYSSNHLAKIHENPAANYVNISFVNTY